LGFAFLLSLLSQPAEAAEFDAAQAARDFRAAAPVLKPFDPSLIVCEAEEFSPGQAGWQPRNWGDNYYAATLANTFLSRKAYLGAEPQAKGNAVFDVQIETAAKYQVLVRYEAVYRYETRFRVRIEQDGKTVFSRDYGSRAQPKIWAFRQKLQPEVAWSWGAVENVVWEGHDAFAELRPGVARIVLEAGPQPEPAARRNVDAILLTTQLAQVAERIEKENYLPLDGLLTQAGDLFVRVQNKAADGTLSVTFPPCQEHSPYWVHQRTWKAQTVSVEPGQRSEWLEVGGLLDALNDGQWHVTAKSKSALNYALEFAVTLAHGEKGPTTTLSCTSEKLELAYDANTRYTRRIRPNEEVLYELLDHLRKQPVRGKPPEQTLIYGYTFEPRPDNPKYNAAVEEFRKLYALVPASDDSLTAGKIPSGYVDWRGQSPAKLAESCEKLVANGTADRVAVVSLGDEISLPVPRADDHEGFRAWLQANGVTPANLSPPGHAKLEVIHYSPKLETAKDNPRVYYYSKRYQQDFGIAAQKQFTDVLRKFLPNARIGANYSPHHAPVYIGETFKWATAFRKQGMTLPWSEDFIWQVPIASQQINTLNVDLCRAAIAHDPRGKILWYVMPHAPGNTPRSWRRQFFSDLAHGVQIFDLFEFRPVQVAYTENHCSDPAMFVEIRKSLHELGTFEDLVQSGRVRRGTAALWFGETGDVWDDQQPPYAAGKRTLYLAARHAQLPLDVMLEADALAGELQHYHTLFLTDRHVSQAAAAKIAEWVQRGGRLVATAGGGLWNEFDEPNPSMAELYGIKSGELVAPADQAVVYEKQDIPFLAPLDRVIYSQDSPRQPDDRTVPIFSAKHTFEATTAQPVQNFADGRVAAVERTVGKGSCLYFGYLPGLSYFHPALPARPAERGTRDSAYNHFLPTAMDARLRALIAGPNPPRPVVSSEPLVESMIIESAQGILVPLINWHPQPQTALEVTIPANLVPGNPTLASGRPVAVRADGPMRIFTLDLDVADVLILRP